MGDDLIWFLISAAPAIKVVTMVLWFATLIVIGGFWYTNWLSIFREIGTWCRTFGVNGFGYRTFLAIIAMDALWALVLWPVTATLVIAWGLWVDLV